MAERRVIVLGKAGNGKSSTGNSILGKEAFNHDVSLNSVTQCCEICNGNNPINKRTYRVCDTPGLLDTNVSLLERLLEVQTSVETCVKPHAFLLVFSSLARLTTDEQHTIDLIRIMFGEKVFDHCIIVFTRGYEIKSDTKFEKFLEQSELFVKLLGKCGGRVVRIENNNSNDGQNVQGDILRLLEMIEIVSDGGKRVYQYVKIDSHKQVLKEYAEEPNTTTEEIDKHLSNICKILDEKLMAEQESLKGDTEKLKSDKKKLNDDKEKLKGDNEKLKGDNGKLNDENEKLKDNNEKLEGNKDKLEGDKKKLKDNIEKLKDNNEKLEDSNEKLEGDKKKLKEDMEKLKEGDKTNLKDSNEKLEGYNEKLEGDKLKDNNEKLNDDKEKLKDNNEKLKGDTKKLKDKHEKLKEDNEKLKDNNEKLEGNNEKLESDKQRLMDKKEKLQDNNKELKGDGSFSTKQLVAVILVVVGMIVNHIISK